MTSPNLINLSALYDAITFAYEADTIDVRARGRVLLALFLVRVCVR